ncbi:hypothetical protein I553_3670 [Mycobacterium xenopi 4042]|uniref:Uncharacterized protein n=1 Tax=Mycobacterium xenopi 4042 TaxID=1299334 RepID=X7ZG24_MYCXE|nr:hypothetical protein I553_3670 [Mycobacterium xenopi 4042]
MLISGWRPDLPTTGTTSSPGELPAMDTDLAIAGLAWPGDRPLSSASLRVALPCSTASPRRWWVPNDRHAGRVAALSAWGSSGSTRSWRQDRGRAGKRQPGRTAALKAVLYRDAFAEMYGGSSRSPRWSA